MIVQGTAGTRKSYLIARIRKALTSKSPQQKSQLLTLAPTGVAAFNIHASTIHSTLQIPIKEMHPLQGQTLTTFQEDMKHIRYILIDEMSLIGPKLLLKIDTRLREAFPHRQHLHFGGVSIILIGDLAQLPPVMDKPLYTSHSTARTLWSEFTTVVTLQTVFRQQGETPAQQKFRRLLQNIQNAEAREEDWQLLMTRTNKQLTSREKEEFDNSMHLFATNDLVRLHNRKMLKSLNHPIAISVATSTGYGIDNAANDEQLEKEVLFCRGQRIMLTSNIWTQAGLVNGALGEVVEIIYSPGSKPPDVPMYVVTRFDNYSGPPWNVHDPKSIPIIPVSLGNRRQIPLTMAWAITIHKAQGLTLQKATIDIGKIDRQGLTFTAISRVKSLNDLRVQLPFSFERYSKMQTNPYTIIRKREEARLQQLCLS